MKTRIGVAATLALALGASPLTAQIVPRGDGSGRTGTTARERIGTVQDVIDAARSRVGVNGDRGSTSRSSNIPRGHLPPRGMCRVWIDGVPPGHQPPVTSCAEAERDRFRYSNARVIYGDRESFPGKGKGKVKHADASRASQRQCSILDGIVVDGRVVDACRDGDRRSRSGRVLDRDDDRRARSGRVVQRDDRRWEDDEDSDSDRKRNKAAKKVAKQRAKAAKKSGRG